MSNIQVDHLDDTYPIAGVDNSSQGFRDNFSIIKTNLQRAHDELEYLEANTMRSDTDTNFNGNQIQNALLHKCAESTVIGDTLLDDYSVDFNYGHYQTYTVGESITIALDGWPMSGYAKLVVQLSGTLNQENIVKFRGPLFADSIRFHSDWPNPGLDHHIVINGSHIHICEFWTTNGGADVFAYYTGEF